MLLCHHMVEQRALVVIEQLRLRAPLIQVAGELEHVVAGAMLASLFGKEFRDAVRLLKIFAVAVAADHIGVVVGDGVPEEARCGARCGIAGDFVLARQTDQLGDIGIGMLVHQFVALGDQRVEHGVMMQALRQCQPLRIAGLHMQFDERFVEAAEFARQHLCNCASSSAAKTPWR